MFENQPKGLWALALANTGERFGYYTMLAVFLLYLQANFGFQTGVASTIYSTFLMMVYFLPIIGGIAADKFGFGKMVTTGIFIMFIGYLVLSLPLGKDSVAIAAMGISLILIALGTGLFKGNLQVMVGRLYDELPLCLRRATVCQQPRLRFLTFLYGNQHRRYVCTYCCHQDHEVGADESGRF